MGERVLAIVGIGIAGVPIIEKAKEMGVRTVGFGMADSLGKDQVDIFEEISIFDLDGMYRACLKHHVTGVIGPSEVSTEPAALLADRLGLPGNRVKGGFFARNKYLMRQKVAGLTTVRQPAFQLYEDGMTVAFPVVVKAVDSCGKQGISMAQNETELVQAVRDARQVSSDHSALVEEYIAEGKEYSVECLAFGESCTVVQVTDKDCAGPPHFAETGHHQPADITVDTRSRIEAAAKDILNVLGITCGMAHLELKISHGDIFFIEVGARGGGSNIADILTPLSTDCDYCKCAIECSLGSYQPRKVSNRNYAGIYYHCKQNEALKEVFQLAETADWTVRYNGKDGFFPDVSNNLDRLKAGYLIYCSDHKIGMADVVAAKQLHVERINDHPKAFEMLWNHNREIGRELPDDELQSGIEKFLHQGNALAILDGEHVIGFLNLYCNNLETLSAYICNVYVLDEYRGCGLSKRLMELAIDMCREKHFKQITLHVKADNLPAISLYKYYGFRFTGGHNQEGSPEMLLLL